MHSRSAVALTVLALALPASAAPLPQKEFARTLPLVSGKLSVDAYKGAIRVHTWDRAEVAVKARVVADESCDRDQAEDVEKTEVVVESVSGGVSVRADYDRVPSRRSFFVWGCSALPFVNFEISMPRSAPLRVKDYKSAIRVEALDGDLSVETYKGTAELRDVAGALDVETYKGDVRIATPLRKDVRVHTYKGDVTLTLPKGAGFTLDAELGRRARLDSDVSFASRGRHPEGRLREDVRGGGPLVKLTTHKGEFRIRER